MFYSLALKVAHNSRCMNLNIFNVLDSVVKTSKANNFSLMALDVSDAGTLEF